MAGPGNKNRGRGKNSRGRVIYLDYASTTPVDADFISLQAKLTKEYWGNPSSAHRIGQRAKKLLDEAREISAKALGARFDEIIFTSSATESNNLALKGAVNYAVRNIERFRNRIVKPKLIVSCVEHSALLKPAECLRDDGLVDLVVLPVDSSGRVDPKTVHNSLDENTILVSIIWANNEIGVVEPIEEIGKVIAEFGKNKISKPRTPNPIPYPLFHTDAVQAFQYVSVDVRGDGVDMLTLGAHKLYAPRGTGILYVRSGAPVIGNLDGGGQEYGFRSSTECVVGAYCMAKALERAVLNRKKEAKRISALGIKLMKGIGKIEGVRHVGDPSPAGRAPHIYPFLFKGVSAEELLYLLDEYGIAASAGSACTTGKLEASHVLKAIQISAEEARNVIRLSLGKYTTREEIDYTVSALVKIIKRIRG